MTLLLTSVIGSYAWPSWFVNAAEAIGRGEYGPADVQEALDDAVDVALRDQEDAGVDVVSDGEMRRLGFFTADFYGRLTGLRALPPDRRFGPGGHISESAMRWLNRFVRPRGWVSWLIANMFAADVPPHQGAVSRAVYARRPDRPRRGLRTPPGGRARAGRDHQCRTARAGPRRSRLYSAR